MKHRAKTIEPLDDRQRLRVEQVSKPVLDLSGNVRRNANSYRLTHHKSAMTRRRLSLFGRAEESSPTAAKRRAKGAGLTANARTELQSSNRDACASDTVRRVECKILQQVASALAVFYDERLGENHRRAAKAILRHGPLRESPDIDSLVG